MSKPKQSTPQLPQNLEAERAVLCAILMNNEYLATARQFVREGDFFLPENSYIFRECVKLLDAGSPVDLILLCEQLQRDGSLSRAGGAPYLASLVDGAARISNVEYHAKLVKELSLKRTIIRTMELAQQNAFNGDTSREILEGALQNIQDLQKEAVIEGLQVMSMEQLFALSDSAVEWILYPFAARGLSMILDALPKMGKTTFFLNGILASRRKKPFLGVATREVRVVYVTEQSGISFSQQARAIGFTGDEPISEMAVFPREIWSRYTFVEFVALLDAFLASARTKPATPPSIAPSADIPAAAPIAGYNLLIFDCWHTIARLEDENDSAEVNRVGNPTMDLAARHGVALALARHDRKAGGAVGVSGRSSIALSGLVDSIAHLTLVPYLANQRKLEIVSRINSLNGNRIIELIDGSYTCFGDAMEQPESVRVAEAIERNPQLSTRELELLTGVGRNRIADVAYESGWIKGRKGWQRRLS